jgi:epoxyqueuosine reductase
MSLLLETVRAAAAPWGLNLVAAVSVARYEAEGAAPATVRAMTQRGARSIIVVANGGGDFWRAFTRYAGVRSGWLERPDPLDDFTRAIVEDTVAPTVRAAGVSCASVYPFASDPPRLNFMQLGRLAGLAGPSIIGVVVHPVFGPWIAFRAALLIDVVLDAPSAALGFDPCPTCAARSCVTGCPAQAVSYENGWDLPGCLKFRVEHERDCAPRCHARAACVLGPEYRYPAAELAYHQGRALKVMRPYYEAHLRPRRED